MTASEINDRHSPSAPRRSDDEIVDQVARRHYSADDQERLRHTRRHHHRPTVVRQSGRILFSPASELQPTGGRLTVGKLASCTDAKLQKAGVSRPKINALRSLIDHVQTRKLQVSKLAVLSDEAVFEKITQVKGMGPWSAQMYLMFVLARPDIFPEKDLGIRKAIVQHYGVELSPDSLEKITACWRPYRTIACLYLWRSLNNRP